MTRGLDAQFHLNLGVVGRPGFRRSTRVSAWLTGFVWAVAALSARAEVMPLTLGYLVERTHLNNPSIQAARLEFQASEEEIEAVQRQRWPTISAVVEDGRNTTGGVTASRFVRVEQNLWDFGRVSSRISESTAISDTARTKVQLQQQLLSLQVVNAWQGLLGAHAKALVAQQTLAKLADYEAQMRRRIAAEVSPAIDLELVQSRSLQTQVELTTAQTAVKTALVRLEQLSGIAGLGAYVDKLEPLPGLGATAHFPELLASTDWAVAANGHPAVARARLDFKAAEYRIQSKQAEQWPVLYARIDQPVAGSAGKTVAFVGVRYSPGAGFSNLAEAKALATRASSLEQGIEAAQREVFEALVNDRDEFFNSRQRVEALTYAVNGTSKVLDSYGRQFTAGRKTWQDLMNAVREVAQNQYALVDANAAMLGAMQRIQVRLGQALNTTDSPPIK